MSKKIITLLTDFGTKDGYSGSCKGIIKSIVPDVEIIDISHDISSYDVNEAAYCLLNYYASFPKGTVHIAVVDPEVGSERRNIIVQTEKYFFVGPDNGIFKLIFLFEECNRFAINMGAKYFKGISDTFHGRDVFAPVAARLLSNAKPQDFGEKIFDLPIDNLYSYNSKYKIVISPALTIDKFGNIITAFSKYDLKKEQVEVIEIKNQKIMTINSYYAEQKDGELFALWNSLGFLEIAANKSSAANILKFDKTIDKIIIKLK